MAPSSLAYKDTSVVGKPECERVDWRLMDRNTGEIIPASCKAYKCPVCGPKKSWSWIGATATFGRPERFLRLSRLPETAEGRRDYMKDIRLRLRRQNYQTEWLWVVEKNPKGTGFHAHVLQWGDYIPQAHLQKMLGGRIPYIEKISSNVGAAGYALKGVGAGGYALKGFRGDVETYWAHLDLNGGRPVHHSRGFFRSQSGERMTATAARKEYLATLGEGEERDWVRIPKASPLSARE